MSSTVRIAKVDGSPAGSADTVIVSPIPYAPPGSTILNEEIVFAVETFALITPPSPAPPVEVRRSAA